LERLRRRSDFRIAAKGARASGRAFVVQAHQRGDDGATRVGFTVSRQVGNAVERNRVRRRLREIVRLSGSAADPMRAGHDYVLIGRRAALLASFDEMTRDLHATLRRVHVAGAKVGDKVGDRAAGSADGSPLHEAGSPPPRHRPRADRRRSSEPQSKPPLRER
jgi:ribonuclease P protein component